MSSYADLFMGQARRLDLLREIHRRDKKRLLKSGNASQKLLDEQKLKHAAQIDSLMLVFEAELELLILELRDRLGEPSFSVPESHARFSSLNREQQDALAQKFLDWFTVSFDSP
jgi:hypothetical protein